MKALFLAEKNKGYVQVRVGFFFLLRIFPKMATWGIAENGKYANIQIMNHRGRFKRKWECRSVLYRRSRWNNFIDRHKSVLWCTIICKTTPKPTYSFGLRSGIPLNPEKWQRPWKQKAFRWTTGMKSYYYADFSSSKDWSLLSFRASNLVLTVEITDKRPICSAELCKNIMAFYWKWFCNLRFSRHCVWGVWSPFRSFVDEQCLPWPLGGTKEATIRRTLELVESSYIGPRQSATWRVHAWRFNQKAMETVAFRPYQCFPNQTLAFDDTSRRTWCKLLSGSLGGNNSIVHLDLDVQWSWRGRWWLRCS